MARARSGAAATQLEKPDLQSAKLRFAETK